MLTNEILPLFTRESERLGVYNFGANLPLPYGILNTEEWCMAIAQEMGKEEECERFLQKQAYEVKRVLGLNYSFTWQANLMMQKRAAVIGRAGFTASLARMLYYDFDTYPRLVALQAATKEALQRAKDLLEPIVQDGIEIEILENANYMQIARAIKEAKIDFVLGSRIEKPLIEGMRLPHLSLGNAYYFQSFRYVPYPYVGYQGILYLAQELALVMADMFHERDKWRKLLHKNI
jgi:nitrogenase molybdenum-iron protein alpha/beta subunit